MKVIVTGGCGFIGSHFCEFYSKKGANVIAIDNMSRDKLLGSKHANTSFNKDFIKGLNGVTHENMDIGELDKLKEIVLDLQQEVIKLKER